MKIGILTHYNVNNQGAQLQMCAMKNWLQERGHEVKILTYVKNFDFNAQAEQKNSGSVLNFKYYIKNYLIDKGMGLTAFNTLKFLTHRKAFRKFETLSYDTDQLDAVIIGSDEVFSIDVGCNKMMYGYGLNAPAIAYAPAFGRSTEELLKEYEVYDLIKDGLSEMFALSARDLHTQEMIHNMTGRDVPLVCDPVLLYHDRNFKIPVKPFRKKYMIVYSYDRNMIDPKEIKAIKLYAKKHKLQTISLGTYHKWCDKNVVCNAEEWFSYFEEAECVVTDTFHGSVVAMKNHCNLAVYIRPSINAFKMESLLQETGLEDRRLRRITPKELEKVLSRDIDYRDVDDRIEKMAEFSGKYLEEALKNLEDKEKDKQIAIKTIERKSIHACSGCGACKAVCPVGAIAIKMNEVGFYEAVIDDNSCIRCGKCQNVCIRYQKETDTTSLYDATLYALQSANSITVKNCSSGGVAHEMSIWALNHGYKVVGVVYDTNTNIAKHVIIDNLKEICSLDGSKYLQSDTNIFVDVVADAKQSIENKYLVFGTPCQITGLDYVTKAEKIRNQFILVDIFCHGVPSYKLWENECHKINKKLGTDQYDDVQFRYKKNDWHSYCLKVTGNGKTFYGSREKEIFYQVFFENVLLGDACMNCEVRKTDVVSDVRIGDYWGARFQNRTDGISAVYTCTECGEIMVQSMLDAKALKNYVASDAEEMLKAQNMAGYLQTKLHDETMNILKETEDINQAITYYRKRMTSNQKFKRILLSASAIIPDDVRAKLRKANSSRQLRKG